MNRVVDLADKLGLFSEHWSPKVVARLNDDEIKLAKLKGEFVWHTHDDTDELFLVIEGTLGPAAARRRGVGSTTSNTEPSQCMPREHGHHLG